MAEAVKFPGTEMEVVERYPGSRRLDHQDFGDVYKTTYAKGEIVDLGVQTEVPLVLDDTCTVEVDGSEYPNIPIFYHCRADCYSEDVGELRENGALRGGAKAFKPEMEVTVMLQEGKPIAIIGHPDHPRQCLDIFRVDCPARIPFSGEGPMHKVFFQATDQKAYCAPDASCTGPYQEDLLCTKKMTRLFGDHEYYAGDPLFGMPIYYGDWLIVLGPRLYIVSVDCMGMVAPGGAISNWIAAACRVYAALYSEDLEKSTIALGKTRQGQYPNRYIAGPLNRDPYPGFNPQPDFTKAFNDLYGNGKKLMQTHWLFSEFYAQEWKETT